MCVVVVVVVVVGNQRCKNVGFGAVEILNENGKVLRTALRWRLGVTRRCPLISVEDTMERAEVLKAVPNITLLTVLLRETNSTLKEKSLWSFETVLLQNHRM